MLSREEIEKLPAGPATDNLVHVQVMGLKLDRYVGSGYEYTQQCYSIDMQDAWHVVDRLQQAGYFVQVNTVGKARVAVKIIEPDKNDGVMSPWPKSFEASSEDAPLAICRAALLVLSHESGGLPAIEKTPSQS